MEVIEIKNNIERILDNIFQFLALALFLALISALHKSQQIHLMTT